MQGHAPFAAATQAVYATLKALRDGGAPKDLKGIASSELTGRVTREADVKARGAEFLGIKKSMDLAIRRVTIRGRVQGVGYRYLVAHGHGAGSGRMGAQQARRQRRGAVFRAGGYRVRIGGAAGADLNGRGSMGSRRRP